MTKCLFSNKLLQLVTCLLGTFKLIMVKCSVLNRLSYGVVISEIGINCTAQLN